ncbi:MAG: hypothetical protein OK455_09740 [Thaumarchaeota archaeon]|nr:hypothetical protein [Nitrososphaerota archaeon]
MKKSILASIVLVVVVVSIIGYYEYSTSEGGVVQTTVVSGKITSLQSSAIPAGANGATSGATYVTITVGSTSFSQLISCVTFPYFVGMTIQVADQTLRSGQHHYSPDIACKGSVSPFKSLHLSQTTSTVT